MKCEKRSWRWKINKEARTRRQETIIRRARYVKKRTWKESLKTANIKLKLQSRTNVAQILKFLFVRKRTKAHYEQESFGRLRSILKSIPMESAPKDRE